MHMRNACKIIVCQANNVPSVNVGVGEIAACSAE